MDHTLTAPILPPLPDFIPGVGSPQISLNDREKKSWTVFPAPIPGIPAPGSESADFDLALLPKKGWVPVIVPSELAMQGFDADNNTEYYYCRQLEIPRDFAGQRIFLRFDGVYSSARCWVDGHFIRSHTGGFTSWDCDITPFVKPGETAVLVVGTADIEGSDIGNYNPDGRILGDPSWASFYAHHNLCGVLRDVTLYARPETALLRLYTEVHFDRDYRDALLEIRAEMSGKARLLLTLTDKDGKKIAGTAMEPGETCTKIPVQNPLHWDAEHPVLYTLTASLYESDALLETVSSRVGFRELRYGGRDGTDPNKLYVNGQPVKLRGVCRHDVSPTSGRSTTKEEDWAEISAYKAANVNHIRTSHYPPSRHLLEACDELGMYVEEETGACFQGANDYDIHSAPEDFLLPFAEMVERDRNHPSVIIWSLGNESAFERTPAFRMEYDYIKKADLSRPVIFSYANTVETLPLPYDICSCHYESFDNNLGGSDIPVLHDEFIHVSCYNLSEQRRDPGVRLHWGSSLKKAWERLLHTDGALGADLWGGIDDVFWLPNGVRERFQNHSGGAAAGYGPWGSVLDHFRRLKPEAYLTQKAYSPIRLDEKNALIFEDTLLIPVENWFDHTHLDEAALTLSKDGGAEEKMPLPDIPPHTKGLIALKGGWAQVKKVKLRFWHQGRLVDQYQITLAEPQPEAAPSSPPPTISAEGDQIIVEAGETKVCFSKQLGTLTAVSRMGEVLVTGMKLHTGEVSLPAWRKDRAVYAAVEGDRAVVALHGAYGNRVRIQYIFRITGDERITVEYQLGVHSLRAGELSELGLSFDIPPSADRVHWDADTLYSLYPDDHLGRPCGTAHRVCSEALAAGYGAAPCWPWKEDMYDPFLYLPGAAGDGLATKDFLTMRTHIHWYQAEFEGFKQAVRAEENGETAVRVALTPDSAKLIVNQQWWYPHLGWGNDPGKPVKFCGSGPRGLAQLRLVPRLPDDERPLY